MVYVDTFTSPEPTRAEIDALAEPVLIEFGTAWCPHCQAAQAPLETALDSVRGLRHVKVEDGPGRRLGRSFRIKLWPTLVLCVAGHELGRVVRPTEVAAIRALFEQLPGA